MKNLIVMLTLLLISQVSQAIVLFDLDKTSYSLNETIMIDVIGRDFSDPLAGFGIDVEFNKDILELQTVKVNSEWSFASKEGERLAGKVAGIGGASLFGVGHKISNSIELPITFVSLEFVARGVGTTDLFLTDANDPVYVWADYNGNAITPDFSNSTLTVVSAVPVPAAFWLMSTALGSMLVCGRRKRS